MTLLHIRNHHVPILLIVEFCHAEDGSEREEEEHRIQQDKARNAHPRDVCRRVFASEDRNITAKDQLDSPQRHINATRWQALLLIPSSTAVYHPNGTNATPNVASMTRIAT